ncbi:two-component system sensor histidine kinase NtrB [Desulfovibrio ferrophilus]|uniref:histidine kinase n=1 Tax=Desulfovibrio ferrophilus TaxID=241368 RepID=A0A2Z6B0D8_9BACT|nr:ATP-binding protein [Desulfovibrio ferrophilus]BBD08933.1 PAS/PAC sensor signal transduction histidine kinase [Desulfovibrio ferrophilus]
MDIGLRVKDRSFLLTAALALMVLGLGLSFLTFQNLRRQRETVEEHMFLASQSILRGIEASLMRELRIHMPGGFMGGRGRMARPTVDLKPRLVEMFDELVAQSDVAFIAFYAQDSSLIIGVQADGRTIPLLPVSGWRALQDDGHWAAMYTGDKKDVFVSGIRARQGLANLCALDPSLKCPPQKGGFPILMVGLNPDRHLDNFNKFKRTALLQTGYVLVVAAFLWGLAVAYLRRRDQSHALHRLETFHSRLLDTMPDGLLTLNCDEVVLAANPAAKRLLGGENELVGSRWSDLPLTCSDGWSDSDVCSLGAGWVQCQAGGRSLEVMSAPIPAEDGAGGERLLLVRDRTELKALEEDLGEAKRLAAIGRLAAGLAHEIRNPLSALRGFAQFFQKKLKGRDPEEQYADTMVREADRLDKVITDLLFLSRPREPEKVLVEMTPLANDLRGLLRFDLEHAGVELDVDIRAQHVLADPDMLKQALINLVLNSLAAVGTADRPGHIGIASFDDENMVAVTVTDNGSGMTPEERAHALEPFFTSKKQGTGLGLAIVHRIARDHGGHVEIMTRIEGEDQGTEVRLLFPAADDDNEFNEGVES